MIVLFILDEFEVSGVTSFVNQYAKILTSNHHKVILLGHTGNLISPKTFFKKCTVIELKSNFTFSLTDKLKRYFHLYIQIKKILDTTEIDCIHFTTTLSAICALLCWKSWRIKKISTFYGAYFLERKSQFIQSEHSVIGRVMEHNKSIFRYWLQYISLLSSKHVISFSTYSDELIRNTFHEKIYKKIWRVPGLISEDTKPRRIYRYQPSKKFLKILTICRIEPRKNIGELLKAISIIRTKGYNVQLTVASPTIYWYYPQNIHLYEQLNLFKAVRFIHKVNEKEKKILFNESDLFIIPSSQYETFGMTILESFSYNRIVIGTNTGAIPEILSRIDKNLIAENYFAESIAERIEWFIQLKDSKKIEILQKSRQQINRYYSTKRWSKTLLNLYLQN